jgi:hypothetical protein
MTLCKHSLTNISGLYRAALTQVTVLQLTA